MGKWTFDKELQDTATAAAGGYSLGNRAPKSEAKPDPVQDADQIDQTGMMAGKKYKRGGYVGARPSGKRMYAKGGMVKGKCGG